MLEEGTFPKPLVFAGVDEGARVPPEYIDGLRKVGIPWFPSTERAYRAIARLADLAKRDLTDRSGRRCRHKGWTRSAAWFPNTGPRRLLRPLGIHFPDSTFAINDGGGRRRGRRARLSGGDEGAGRRARPQERCRRGDPRPQVRRRGARGVRPGCTRTSPLTITSIALDGVLIERMGKMGTEMIVGAKHDPEWGPVVLAGFGGVTAEILKDVKLFTPDMDQAAVHAGLLGLKQAAILKGYRGSPAKRRGRARRADRPDGPDHGRQPGIREIDLNPVIVHRRGRRRGRARRADADRGLISALPQESLMTRRPCACDAPSRSPTGRSSDVRDDKSKRVGFSRAERVDPLMLAAIALAMLGGYLITGPPRPISWSSTASRERTKVSLPICGSC